MHLTEVCPQLAPWLVCVCVHLVTVDCTVAPSRENLQTSEMNGTMTRDGQQQLVGGEDWDQLETL